MEPKTFTFTLAFLGLVAFVPMLDNEHKLQSVWVLLVNAEDGTPPCSLAAGERKGMHATGHESHFAAMRYAARNVVGAKAKVDRGAEPTVLTYLLGNDIRIQAGGNSTFAADQGCPTEDADTAIRRVGRDPAKLSEVYPLADSTCDATAFSWVLSLGDLAPHYNQVCDRCLEDPPSRAYPWNRVAARVKLDRGLLRADRLSAKGYPSSRPLAYAYPADGSIFKQVVAEDVSLRLEGLTQPVVLKLRNEENEIQEITLVPVDDEKEVRVEILNKPGWALLGAANPGAGHMDMRDFSYYYRLSDVAPDCAAGLPIPEPFRGEAGPPICPSMRISPSVGDDQ